MSTPALTISHLTVRLGGRTVIDDVSLDVEDGALLAVVGRSGAGKSVLWKAACGLLERHGGDVVVQRPPLVFVHQDPALLEDRSVRDNLALGLPLTGSDTLITEVAARLHLLDVLDVPAHRLSPAQARRAALARALVRSPGILVVDEPTTGLDAIAAADVERALAAVGAGGAAVVVITHHPRTLASLVARGARVVVIDAGVALERRAA